MAFDVSTADIESRWRTLSDDESDVGAQRLLDAGVRLRSVRPGLEAQVAALAELTPAQVAAKADVLEAIRIALAEAVIRFLRNPDVTQRQDIGADGSIGISYDTSRAGGVYIADEDLSAIDDALGAAGGTVRARVRSQQLVTSFPYRREA